MTIGFIVMGVAGFGWGALSDRIGARPVVIMGAVLLGVGLFIASNAPNILVFQLSYGALVGASGSAFFAPLTSATLGWFDKNRGLAISLASIGGGVAPMIFSQLAAMLIQDHGMAHRHADYRHHRDHPPPALSLLVRSAPVAGAPAATTVASPGAAKGIDFSPPRTPQFIVLAVTFLFCCGAHSGPIFHTVSYAMILCGVNLSAATNLYSIEGVAGLFGRLICGFLADRYGPRKVIVGGLALQAVGIYSYIYVSQLPHFYILAAVLGIVYGGVMPLYSVLAREYFSQSVMGTVLGAAGITSSLGMAFGPVAGGWLYDTYGTYHWLYIASAAVGVAAALLALAFPPPNKHLNNGTPTLQPA